MKHYDSISAAALFALALAFAIPADAAKNQWDQISLAGPIDATLPDGSKRAVNPSCSGGPQIQPDGSLAPASTDYYFFVQKGNPNKLLIGLDGGGACWDAATCIGSPLTGNSTYTVSLDETPQRLADSEGLFDARNPENPFQNYTKIFIPYCSADVHWGSKDTTYVLPLGGGALPWTIHHRGTDNFVAVLDWLKKNGRKAYGIDFGRARDVTVTGASAGGYGANLAFAYVAEMTPRARLSLISDAAIGVQNESFYKTGIYDPATGTANWGVERNLPPWVPGLDEGLLATQVAYPSGLVRSIFGALSAYKPDARLATLTSNLDGVQIGFYGLMVGDFPPGIGTAIDWYTTMAIETALTAQLPNYRFFIDDGTFHTFIGSDQRVYEVGANGITLAAWIRAMVKPGNRTWENLDAGPPSLP